MLLRDYLELLEKGLQEANQQAKQEAVKVKKAADPTVNLIKEGMQSLDKQIEKYTTVLKQAASLDDRQVVLINLIRGMKVQHNEGVISYNKDEGVFTIDNEPIDINMYDLEDTYEYVEKPKFQYVYRKQGKFEITDFITEDDARVRLGEYEYKKVEL